MVLYIELGVYIGMRSKGHLMIAMKTQENILAYENLNDVYREVMLIILIHVEVRMEATHYSPGAFP